MSVPAWAELPTLASQTARRAWPDAELLGQDVAEFRREARDELLAAAQRYVAGYLESAPAYRRGQPLVVVGHQPELVHPGVWVKNFAAAAVAQQIGGLALHLVIDTDSAHVPSIRIPSGSVDHPRFESLPFDAPHAPMAWEQRRIVDAAAWESFGPRAADAMGAWGVQPFARQWWPQVVNRSRQTGNPGLALAQARHTTEQQWGVQSLELPHSAACQTTAFRRFACHVLAHLPRFVECYNGALAEFRRRHHIRNHAQPAPNLATERDWLEAPFWLWSDDNPARRPVFVSHRGEALVVSDRHGVEATLQVTADGDPAAAIEQLAAWEARGVKLRTRALVTTLFARLALADLFVHGIGGARYDEATDALSRRFFGVELAPYAAISGTLRLPLAGRPIVAGRVSSLRRQLRDIEFHPERFLDAIDLPPRGQASAEQAQLDKNHWVATTKTPANAAERHRQIVRANATMSGLLAPMRQESEQQLAVAVEQARAATVLESREYAFCLFPQDRLRQFLLDFPTRFP